MQNSNGRDEKRKGEVSLSSINTPFISHHLLTCRHQNGPFFHPSAKLHLRGLSAGKNTAITEEEVGPGSGKRGRRKVFFQGVLRLLPPPEDKTFQRQVRSMRFIPLPLRSSSRHTRHSHCSHFHFSASSCFNLALALSCFGLSLCRFLCRDQFSGFLSFKTAFARSQGYILKINVLPLVVHCRILNILHTWKFTWQWISWKWSLSFMSHSKTSSASRCV